MITYQFEYETRIRSAFIGAGGHSYRNIYPSFQYAPVDLVAVCDVQPDRASAYARLFGGGEAYGDYRQMLRDVRPDAVFIVTSYDPETGRVQATDIALDCLRAGANVWMEKPAAASREEVLELKRVSEETGRCVVVGLKKLFTPAFLKVEEIVADGEFGPITSVYVRYPQSLPARADRRDLRAMRGFLDHIYHPGALLTRLLGRLDRFTFDWESESGSSIAIVKAASGAIGTLHFAAGMGKTSPLERLEVVGKDANIVVDNGVRVSYHRSGNAWNYGRSASYAGPNERATLYWEPEFSLGTLDNKNLFYLGYVPELLHFCESVETGAAPTRGTLDDAAEVMRLFEAFRTAPEGTSVELLAGDQFLDAAV